MATLTRPAPVAAPAGARTAGSLPSSAQPVGAADLPRVLARLARCARRELCTFYPAQRHNPGAALHAVMQGQLRRGVQASVVCGADGLDDRPVRERLEQLAGAGARVRVTDTLPHWLVTVDHAVAVVLVEPVVRWGNVVLVRDLPLVTGLQALFATTWQRATPLAEVADGDDERLSDRDLEVLRVMTSGLVDARAADELGVSVRTYRRCVADLMDRLGARSRFQAGVHAAERGWV